MKDTHCDTFKLYGVNMLSVLKKSVQRERNVKVIIAPPSDSCTLKLFLNNIQ